jgi:hypothetical protein
MPESIKFLEENTGRKLHDIGFGNGYDAQNTGNKRKN